MNDKFKFKAWHVKENRLYYGGLLREYQTLVFWDQPLDENDEPRSGSLHTGFYDPDLIKLQCTGLRDKNGKLIFEGDIIRNIRKRDDFDENEVIWDGETACFALDEGISPYDNKRSMMDFNCIFESLEVIGNKFENPEFLSLI